MSKRPSTRRRARRQPNAVTIAAARERASLKRLVIAKRDVSRLVNELRRATDRAEQLTIAFAHETLRRHGFAPLVRPAVNSRSSRSTLGGNDQPFERPLRLFEQADDTRVLVAANEPAEG